MHGGGEVDRQQQTSASVVSDAFYETIPYDTVPRHTSIRHNNPLFGPGQDAQGYEVAVDALQGNTVAATAPTIAQCEGAYAGYEAMEADYEIMETTLSDSGRVARPYAQVLEPASEYDYHDVLEVPNRPGSFAV